MWEEEPDDNANDGLSTGDEDVASDDAGLENDQN